MFGYAKEHEPCIIFMDEIDAIGGRRFSEGTSADREIQRTLMELLNQLDGFDYLGKTKIIMATNRPDTLDPALLRAGRLDRKIEIPLPNEVGRLEILKIHSSTVQLEGDIDFESVVKMSDGLNGADLRNVVTEAYVLPLLPIHLVMLSLTLRTVVYLPLKTTVTLSTRMTSTERCVRWRKLRSWKASWSTKSCSSNDPSLWMTLQSWPCLANAQSALRASHEIHSE
jgi:26S proteasome regulatory subunit T4